MFGERRLLFRLSSGMIFTDGNIRWADTAINPNGIQTQVLECWQATEKPDRYPDASAGMLADNGKISHHKIEHGFAAAVLLFFAYIRKTPVVFSRIGRLCLSLLSRLI
jgi:hypothetical protein